MVESRLPLCAIARTIANGTRLAVQYTSFWTTYVYVAPDVTGP